MGHAVFVFGAAGAGKTTFCRNLREYSSPSRNIKLINLDPAQEDGADYDVDLCDYITVQEVMENYDFGPNGALFFALQEMCENIDELKLQDFEEDYFVFDCPGQIELFLHSDIMVECIKYVKSFAKVALVYVTDGSNFLIPDKHIYSSLCATLTMSRFDLPVINVVSKADLLEDDQLESIISGSIQDIEIDGNDEYSRLKRNITEYVNYNGMMDFYPIDWSNEEMIENIYVQLDNILQRYDDNDPKDIKEDMAI